MTSKTKWLIEDIFIFFKNGTAFLWDYKHHKQYELSEGEFERLRQFSAGASTSLESIDLTFQEALLLKDEPPSHRWGWDLLSKIFHIGTSHPHEPTPDDPTQYSEYAKSYLNFCKSIQKEAPNVHIVKGGERTLLPAPDFSRLKHPNLWDSLLSRRTCRDFYDEPVSLEILSTILYGTFGDIETPELDAPIGLKRFGFRRTSPSAGGLQSTEAYLWVKNVKDLEPAVYHYVSNEHVLERVNELPEQPVATYLCGQHWANDLAFTILLTSRLDKLWWKYPHSRAYRPMLIDIGHLSQTASLLITAQGLSSWMTGYFHDNELNEILRLDVPNEQILFVVGGGYGTGSSYTKEVRRLIDDGI